jgi:hypothetical protein
MVMKTGFSGRDVSVFKIEPVVLQKEWLWPICLFNRGNDLDFPQSLNFLVIDKKVITTIKLKVLI